MRDRSRSGWGVVLDEVPGEHDPTGILLRADPTESGYVLEYIVDDAEFPFCCGVERPFWGPALLNGAGEIVFSSGGDLHVAESGELPGSSNRIRTIVEAGVTSLPGFGTFDAAIEPRRWNDSSELLFGASNAAGQRGLFVADPTRVRTLAVDGELVPNGNGRLNGFGGRDFDARGEALFTSRLADTKLGRDDDLALFQAGPGGLTEIAREGEPSPGGAAFEAFGAARFGSSGEIHFVAESADGSQALFRSGAEGLERVLELGPNTYDLRLNREGQLLVHEVPLGTPGRRQLLFFDGSHLTTIVKAGDPRPDARGPDEYFDGSAGDLSPFYPGPFNDAGQLLFESSISGENDDPVFAHFFFDPELGLHEVARPDLRFPAPIFASLNDAGQVAYMVETFDGDGLGLEVRVWALPEPGRAGLLMLALLGVSTLRHRRCGSSPSASEPCGLQRL